MYPGKFAESHRDKPAIAMADTGESLTYGGLEERSIRLARVLQDAGLRRGDHIAFLSQNCPEVFVMLWAGLRSGLYVTAVNFHLSVDEASYVIDDCGAQALLVSAEKKDLAEGVVDLTPKVGMRLAFGGEVSGYQSYEDAMAKVSAEEPADQPVGADMLYSSGTTGRPKGIKPSLGERQINEPGDPYLAVFGPLFGFDDNTVYYSPAPTYHAAPLRFGQMVTATGGTLVMTERFDAEEALRIIHEHKVTHSQWVPTMFVRMLKLDPEVRGKYDMSSLRVAIHAAAPCPVDVKQQMMDWWGPILYEYFSSTEANGITLIKPDDWLEHPGSVGKAALGTIRVCDDEGTELSANQIGTVFFERETLPFQYHNAPEKTREAQHPQHENWTTTGDIGYVDSEGYLYLTDRKAFMIISGGVNIYPQEIEDCLTLHAKVLDVAVIGLPDREMGEAVKAVVEPQRGMATGPDLEQELLAFVRERIAGYKVPRSIDFIDELPRTPTGKLVKRTLQERYTEEAASSS